MIKDFSRINNDQVTEGPGWETLYYINVVDRGPYLGPCLIRSYLYTTTFGLNRGMSLGSGSISISGTGILSSVM